MMIPTAGCPKCGYNLYGRVTVQNLFAEIGASVKNNSLEYKPARLHADGVVVEFTEFYCPNCHKIVVTDSIVFRCALSSITGLIGDFIILRFTNANGKPYNKPYVIHKMYQDKVVNDMARDGYALKSANPVSATIKATVEGG
jgi:predicted RNA-binding Zn-ribbon protein involved in translation (DUF1610 family)